MNKLIILCFAGLSLFLKVENTLAATEISGGGFHTCAVKNNGYISCWGNNVHGQLGDGSNTSRSTPLEIDLNEVQAVSGGWFHTCAVKYDNSTFCWGNNRQGQLGNGLNTNSNLPLQIDFNETKIISGGWFHTCAIENGGHVFCWGDNSQGQLGNNSIDDANLPTRVNLNNEIQSISGGRFFHVCALSNMGSIFCWGNNTQGQLGNGSNINSNIPLKVNNLNYYAISVGGYHTCAIENNTSVSCWGKNDYGQLGNGSNINSNIPVTVKNLIEIQAISLGWNHSCALSREGYVFCWGKNDSGQLGDNSNSMRTIPIKINELSDVQAISAGGNHTCALKNNGNIFCWGNNFYGQLGEGSNTSRNTPTKVLSKEKTPVLLANIDYIKAKKTPAGIRIRWKTNAELKSGHFHVWRFLKIAQGRYTQWHRITTQPISAQGVASSYFYDDFNVEVGKTYAYYLEEVELDGQQVFYLKNPTEATVQ